MEKILVLYASYGGGHLSAAKSISQYIEENYPNVQVNMVDCMKSINKALEKVTTGAYREMAKRTPKLWGKVYSGSQKGLLSGISKNTNRLMAKKLFKLIENEKPSIVISTHPFSSQMVSYLKRKGRINCTLATILTDFAIHKQWLVGHEFTDYFFVSNEAMKNDMIKFGIDKNKIYVTGIPMSSNFLKNFDTNNIYEMFNLVPEKKVILFFGGGGFGLSENSTSKILKSLIEVAKEYQIVVVSGKNEKLKKTFENLINELNVTTRVKVLGFTDKVPELMHIASIVVSKPGGLTTTETLACELPMVIINPIPGQEEENAMFLEEHGAGIWLHSYENLENVFTDLFSNEEKLEKMKNSAKLLSKKNSTKDICSILL